VRKVAGLVLALSLSTLGGFAQSFPTSSEPSHPQIAFRLLSTWVDNHDRSSGGGQLFASTFLMTAGGLGLATAGLTWFAGDEISTRASGYPLASDVKQGIVLGAGIGGAALVATGVAIRSMPVQNQRQVYADIFGERDPEVQEAMAVAALRDQAAKGKERRITSFISSLVVPLITGGIKVGINLSLGDPWSKDLGQSFGYSSWSMVSGLSALVSKSKEELLYDRYLSTRDALYGQPISKP